jgi:hypothetical protein
LTGKLFFAKVVEKVMNDNEKPVAEEGWGALGVWPQTYQRLRDQLAQTPWICQGSVVCRPLLRQVQGQAVKKGPYYLWTCKVKGKTVCQALSKAQYLLISKAIANNTKLQKIVAQMQNLTLKSILRKVPGVKKRK